MRFLVLGGGAQGSAAAFDLVRAEGVEEVVVGDVSLEHPRPFLKPFVGDRLRFARVDATDHGSMREAMEGVDAIAFTGGIGENAAPIRARILEGLGWAGLRIDPCANDSGAARLHEEGSPVSCWIVPAWEERMIAADAQALLAA